jgi:hypothetical protein
LLCSSCGSKGIHIGCGKLDWSTMEWDCDDCSSLDSRRNSANASPNAEVPVTVPPASTLLNPAVIASATAPRTGVKRPRSGDSTSESEAEAGSSDDEGEVDIISVSDAESPANSVASPTCMIPIFFDFYIH